MRFSTLETAERCAGQRRQAQPQEAVIQAPNPRPPLPVLVPRGMSYLASKRWFFAHDIVFRETWCQFADRWREGLEAKLRKFTFVLFKPDGVIGRSIEPCVAALEEFGFVPVTMMPVRLNRHSIRELWQYDLNLATLERMTAIDILLAEIDSWLLVLADQAAGSNSACLRLGKLKGSSRPKSANDLQPFHLRARIGARTGLLNYIHTPDEAADFVREIGVLLETALRRELMDAMDGVTQPFSDFAVARIYDGLPQHSLDVQETVVRVSAHCSAHRHSKVRQLVPILSRAAAGDLTAYNLMVQRLQSENIGISRWDFITLVAGYANTDIPGVRPFLEYVDYSVR